MYANGKVAQNFEYSGSCPVNLKFDWGLLDTYPGAPSNSSVALKYYFTRSDGGRSSSTQTVNMPSNKEVDVFYTWILGANTAEFKDYSGWVGINLDLMLKSPPHKINFTLHCK